MTSSDSSTGIRTIIPGPQGPIAPIAIIRQRRTYPDYGSTLPRGSRVSLGHVGFVQFTLSGRGRVVSENGESFISVGSCLLCCLSDHVHYEAAPEGWEFVYMSFSGRSAQTFIEDLTQLYGHVLRCDIEHGVIKRLLEYTESENVQVRQFDTGLAARVAGEVLVQLTEWNARQAQGSERLLHDAMALLSKDLSDPPSISAVAKELGVSREHLSRQFAEQLACPPARWLQQERLRHAAVLLRTGQEPIKDIAAAVGFHTPSAFTAAFRGLYGSTPGHYRAG